MEASTAQPASISSFSVSFGPPAIQNIFSGNSITHSLIRHDARDHGPSVITHCDRSRVEHFPALTVRRDRGEVQSRVERANIRHAAKKNMAFQLAGIRDGEAKSRGRRDG